MGKRAKKGLPSPKRSPRGWYTHHCTVPPKKTLKPKPRAVTPREEKAKKVSRLVAPSPQTSQERYPLGGEWIGEWKTEVGGVLGVGATDWVNGGRRGEGNPKGTQRVEGSAQHPEWEDGCSRTRG